MQTKNILVLCGGQSTEHEISLLSARNVLHHLDKDKYHVTVAYITREGKWFHHAAIETFLSLTDEQLSHPKQGALMQITPGEQHPFANASQPIPVDCVFPVLHGNHGEDGSMQGFLDINNVPYVGADCLGASIAMHKDVTKLLLQQASLPVVPWMTCKKTEADSLNFSQLQSQFGLPFFVKANSLGSSVGVYQVQSEADFEQAMAEVFDYDDRILIEQGIEGREIECSVLGNGNPVASLPGEIINHKSFYTYEAKYQDATASTVQTPAELDEATVSRIRQLSIKAYKAVRCEGMARVDFFLTKDMIYISELNTIPGFTSISLYPKNWEVTGLKQSDLLDELIQLAFKRYDKLRKIKHVPGLLVKTS